MKNQKEKKLLNLKREKVASFETLKLLGGTGCSSNKGTTTGRTQTTTDEE